LTVPLRLDLPEVLCCLPGTGLGGMDLGFSGVAIKNDQRPRFIEWLQKKN
jgi:hypothetical protein